ncbi:MAG: hypothetical protein U9O87_01645 [Verrucomicrobiota bacterium]|nr:hypothetical protein [Verrucomicrobiota bacterium]
MAVLDAGKILLFKDIEEKKDCSKITIRRHLKKLKAISSYNKKWKYYTLLSIANFDSNGLWFCKGVFFSKYGNLIRNIVDLIASLEKGFSAETFNPLKFQFYSLLRKIEKRLDFHRRKISAKYIYFLNNAEKQKNQIVERQVNASGITDSVGIVILVAFIKNPKLDIERLHSQLSSQKNYIYLKELTEF